MMKLCRFLVREFRSIHNSGWIDCNDVTTLVGINEAGKSNLLLALWKLNPAREGEIDLLADIPRESYSTLRDAKIKPDFIEAELELDDKQAQQVANLAGANTEDIRRVLVKRNYNARYKVSFPDANVLSKISAQGIDEILQSTLTALQSLKEAGKGEHGIKNKAISAVKDAQAIIVNESVDEPQLSQIIGQFDGISSELKTSQIVPCVQAAKEQINEYIEQFQAPHPDANDEAIDYVLQELPSFVYYSAYGNLDSEIYLPHVIENMSRDDLTGRIAAQTRTLRVLFNFVGLDPEEILAKGKEPRKEFNPQGQLIKEPSKEEIEQAARDKQERDVLLHSASTRLTKEFRRWWRQGNYVFDLAADGNHFRIWVSDEDRPAKVELESRSTGLQWFLSFFLVFLVESEETHKGAILLLDEAGLSLHALAQKDLIEFFEKLSDTNQIVHTTHSPFLVNTDHIDRVRVVYMDANGYTVGSSDLRAAEKDPRQTKSIYAVHAALGLSVSETMLQGCHPVIVEGQSDQYYLSAVKVYLIGVGKLRPAKEIIFAPSGGVKGVTSTAAIIASKEDKLPIILLDSDESGKHFKKKLISNQYSGIAERIIEINDVLDIEGAEIEDLFPFMLMRHGISRIFRNIEDNYFEDSYDKTQPIVPQIEDFAVNNNIDLATGWKVELARQVKNRLLSIDPNSINDELITVWCSLFKKIYPH